MPKIARQTVIVVMGNFAPPSEDNPNNVNVSVNLAHGVVMLRTWKRRNRNVTFQRDKLAKLLPLGLRMLEDTASKNVLIQQLALRDTSAQLEDCVLNLVDALRWQIALTLKTILTNQDVLTSSVVVFNQANANWSIWIVVLVIITVLDKVMLARQTHPNQTFLVFAYKHALKLNSVTMNTSVKVASAYLNLLQSNRW